MSKKVSKKKKTKQKKLLMTFLKAVGITFAVCVVLAGIGMWAYKTFIFKGDPNADAKKDKNNTTQGSNKKEKDINKTVAIFGVDRDGTRTDVMFLVHFNSETNKVKIVSVPRDTRVEWTDEQIKQGKELSGYYTEVSKLNEMTVFSGLDHIRDFTIKQIENLLGVKVDNYALVTIDSFREIVDAIDGVEVDVPMDMNYEDPYQDLYIHLEKGPQVLDGKHAEMLVRFRKGYNGTGYAEGDVGRIKTQHLFLEAFAKKIMSPEIILKLPQIVTTLMGSVTTDIPLSEIPEYYGYVKNFDLTNLKFGTVPGEGKYIGNVSYFIPDVEKLQPFINEMILDIEPVDESKIEPVVDKTVTIEILNASGVTGAASTAKTTLETGGYSVSNIGNYTKEQLTTTKILGKDLSKAKQFKQYYPNAKIELDETLEYDVQILLGVE